MASDFGTVTYADNRYDRRTLTWQCFIMFYLKTNASSTVNRNLTEHAALGMQVGKVWKMTLPWKRLTAEMY